jgi:FdhD protein
VSSTIRRPVAPTRVISVRAGVVIEVPDTLAGEEPMEIRVEAPGQPAQSVAVTMRTPGNDFELAAGFLVTESILTAAADLATVRYCELPDGAEQQYNVVTVSLRNAVDLTPLRRNVYASSSCGICGKASIEQVAVHADRVPPVGGAIVALSTVLTLPALLRADQQVFDRTGGLHAAGLFTPAGELLVLREDVGRHNAIDKVVGRSLLDDMLPLHDRVLVVSGRVSFEVVQKAAAAGVPVIVAVSAPTSLAVETARQLGITIVGFVRDRDANIYTHAARINLNT